MDRLNELLRADMAARGVKSEKKEQSAIDLTDRYAGERGKYGEIKKQKCEAVKKAITEHHNQLAKIGEGVSAINSDIYDIDGDLALYQTRVFIKAEGQRFAKTKIRYWIARLSGEALIENKTIALRGQTIHYFIRNGKSPIAALRAEGKL